MKTGSIGLGEHLVLLAPMKDTTGISFRLICRRLRADTVCTEFVLSDVLIHGINKTQQKLNVSDDEHPVAIQVYGKGVASTVEAACICEEAYPDILDINFGCPVKRVADREAGVGMPRSIPLMLEITREMMKAVNILITAEIRLGWDADNRTIMDLVEQLQDCGIAALPIHGRTRAQTYMGEADRISIGAVKNNSCIRIPIIGNSGMTSAEICKQRFEDYGVDAVMIGKTSIGRPWAFREIKHYLMTRKLLPQKSFSWYLDILKEQMEQSMERLDERRGTLHIHRHLTAIPSFKGITGLKQIRIVMLCAGTVNKLFETMSDILKKYGILG